jgi:hypothetical protein
MIQVLALALAYAGFTALALAMDRHHRQVWRRTASGRTRILLRAAGILGLGLSLATCIVQSGWSVGLVLWLGVLTAATLAVVVGLAWWLSRGSSEELGPSRRPTTN